MDTGLSMYFGHLNNEIFAVDSYFDSCYESSWFESDIAKSILKEICNMVEMNGLAITVDYYKRGDLVTISPEKLPGGVKALLIMLNTDKIVQACRCGNNCAKWILEISKVKRLKIAIVSFMTFRTDFDAYVINDGSYIHSYEDYIFKSVEFLNKKHMPDVDVSETKDE